MKWPIMRYICDTQDSGYGNAARGYMQAFKSIGISGETLRIVPVMAPTSTPAPLIDSSIDDHGPFTQAVASSHDPVTGKMPANTGAAMMGTVYESDDPMNPYISGNWPGNDVINIVHLNPGMCHTYHTSCNGRYNILITAWETDRLTQRQYQWGDETRTMVQDINDYDEVWVPTRSVKKIFVKSGVTKPIFVIPHVLREELVKMPINRSYAIGKDKPVGFYAIGPWNARKNHVDLVRAYYGTRWSIMDRVRLQLFTLPTVRDQHSVEAHEFIANADIRNLRESHPQGKLNVPSISLMASPRRFMYHIKQAHVQNHVFITASRGEGFCLPALDAVALGNHVVGGFPALEDLSVHAPGLVTYLHSNKVPITPMPEVRGYEIDHEWWETPIKSLSMEMKALKDWVQETGESMKDEVMEVRKAYHPKTIGKLIKKRLEAVSDIVASSGW
jgi:hypothetical protein